MDAIFVLMNITLKKNSRLRKSDPRLNFTNCQWRNTKHGGSRWN